MTLPNRSIDIIIPIYNAYEDLIRCMESIQTWTDLTRNRLILVNDKSPDERIYEYLEKCRKENIIVIHNETNKGFSANINTGMAQSEVNDVILLNSDTVVTKNWVQKLEACAYSDRTIATVTPLSNNATLCSVPVFCAENTIPCGYTLDEYAELIERISLQKYPEIPVAHGFCMYVKREVIDKIGTFDAETFERGYGEENDFCYRAIEAGYHHVMCDDTFILHTGTSSFLSEEKQRYIAAHERIIDTRYPDLNRDVQIHCRDNPNAMVSENVRFWADYNKRTKRRTMMYLVQSDFREGADDNVGGTQLHVKDLTIGLRDFFDILVAARDKAYLNVTLYTQNKDFFFRYYIGECEHYNQFRSEKFAGIYRKILENFGVDCVHIHHTKDLSLELFYEASKMKIPVLATVHDYYYICPAVKLLNEKNELCADRDNNEKCKECIKSRMGIIESIPYIEIWRREHRNALACAEVIFTPSNNAKKIFSNYYDELKARVKVIGHGSQQLRTEQKNSERKEKETFNVAFFGGISDAKGCHTAIEMIKKGAKDIRWHLFGTFEHMDSGVARRDNFVNVGSYQREELPALMKKYEIDLICILPIWPETFCYTVSEAVMCNVPVVVTDIGALGERVREMDCGWVVTSNARANDVLNIINRLKSRGNEYQQKLEKTHEIQIKTIDEMCCEYREVYEKCLPESKREVTEYNYEWLLSGIMCGLGKKSYVNEENDDNVREQLENVERRLHEVTNSFTYRAVQMIAKIKIPFRKQIKAVFVKIYRVIGV